MLQIPESQPTSQTAKSDMAQKNPSTTLTTNTLALPPALRAMTATFNTAELLENILSYLPAPQLLRSKPTCRNFHNAIVASPTLRRKTSTYLLLNDVDETDLFKTDAGGDVVYPIRDLSPLAFFYPSDGERRIFVRFCTSAGRFEGLRKARGFREVVVVDQVVEGGVIGWHCGCFEGGRAEAELGSWSGRVTFGDLFGAMEGRHEGEGLGVCRGVGKFWLDGVWGRRKEVRQLG